MATRTRSNDVGKRLVEILGLPKETKWLEIRFAVDEMVSIKGEFYLEDDQIKSFFGFLKDYKADITEGAKNGK
jgi:hypothetical protein